jgi:hypothetical protein
MFFMSDPKGIEGTFGTARALSLRFADKIHSDGDARDICVPHPTQNSSR